MVELDCVNASLDYQQISSDDNVSQQVPDFSKVYLAAVV